MAITKSQIAYSTATSTLALVAATVSADAQDWTGFYGGLSFSAHGGELGNGGSADYDVVSSQTVGVFAGHNWSFGPGNTLVGVELAFSPGAIDSVDEYTLEDSLDVKARLGQSFGKTMVYGFAGYSVGNTKDSGDDVNYFTSGTNVGIGVAHRVGDNMTLGLELMQRRMDVSPDYGSNEVNTISFRATLDF